HVQRAELIDQVGLVGAGDDGGHLAGGQPLLHAIGSDSHVRPPWARGFYTRRASPRRQGDRPGGPAPAAGAPPRAIPATPAGQARARARSPRGPPAPRPAPARARAPCRARRGRTGGAAPPP